MKFTATRIPGASLVDLEEQRDERGFFARTMCVEEFARQGLEANFVQSNISYNTRKGTLRGMHQQTGERAECKLVRCVRGAIYDVIIDLRADSPMYKQWLAVELTADNRRALYIPRGCAHGFLTLLDATEVMYMHTQFYAPGSERNVRWNDPVFAIDWPQTDSLIMSERDAGWPDFRQ